MRVGSICTAEPARKSNFAAPWETVRSSASNVREFLTSGAEANPGFALVPEFDVPLPEIHGVVQRGRGRSAVISAGSRILRLYEKTQTLNGCYTKIQPNAA